MAAQRRLQTAQRSAPEVPPCSLAIADLHEEGEGSGLSFRLFMGVGVNPQHAQVVESYRAQTPRGSGCFLAPAPPCSTGVPTLCDRAMPHR